MYSEDACFDLTVSEVGAAAARSDTTVLLISMPALATTLPLESVMSSRSIFPRALSFRTSFITFSLVIIFPSLSIPLILPSTMLLTMEPSMT